MNQSKFTHCQVEIYTPQRIEMGNKLVVDLHPEKGTGLDPEMEPHLPLWDQLELSLPLLQVPLFLLPVPPIERIEIKIQWT